MKSAPLASVFVLVVAVLGCNHDVHPRNAEPAPLAPPPRPYLVHLPGIGGHRSIDRMLTEGLVQGGIDVEVEVYNWTQDDPGLSALYARERHQLQADRVAQIITARYRRDPRTKIYLSGHSGGSGIALWALERLPADVQIESLLMLAPAVSPRYDLSRALRHVRAKAYALHSPYDPVLGIGTRLFGTIDGVKTDAAGRVGFSMPIHAADASEYDKLVTVGYDPAWIRFSNLGDHIGPMMRPFAREILSPLLRTGVLRQLTTPTTKPGPATDTTTRTR